MTRHRGGGGFPVLYDFAQPSVAEMAADFKVRSARRTSENGWQIAMGCFVMAFGVFVRFAATR